MKCAKCNADSATTDFCDQCGEALSAQAKAPVTVVFATATTSGESVCPCGEPRVADAQFCEACGYDFLSKSMPQAVQAQPAQPQASGAGTVQWRVIVTSDQSWAEKNGGFGIAFPADYPSRQFPLDAEKIVLGRRAEGGINLGNREPKDTAVSGEHVTFVRQADGSYAFVDYKSTNGTFLNGACDQAAYGVETVLSDGDYLNIGAWTRVTIQKI